MILEEVLADTGTRYIGDRRIWLKDGGWSPPPVLQVCHELRLQGLPLWVKMPGRHHLHGFDSKDIVGQQEWFEDIERYYQIDLPMEDTVVELCGLIVDRDLAAANLTAWVRYFYKTGRCALVLKEDVDDEWHDAEPCGGL